METLPPYVKLLSDGFSLVRAPALQRTEMASGPVKQLKTMSRVMVTRQVRLLFTSKADYTAFIDWFQQGVNFGADWFNWTDPLDKVEKPARLVGGLKSETPITPNLNTWEVQTAIETWSST